jgi:RNA-directed DNA polymerase
MTELTDIIEAYMAARRNKRRTADQTDFELHWESGCCRLLRDIRGRSLRPTAYTFISHRPRPREVFASDMATRVLHHYIDIRLRPLLERKMGPHTFNNRVGMGQSACQNAVVSDIYEMTEGHTGDAWVIKLDLKGCFPNIVQDIAYRQLREVVESGYKGSDKDDLLYILQVCVFSYPTLHCEVYSSPEERSAIEKGKSLFDKPPGIGAAIGHLIWQNAVNWYFHGIDEWLDSFPEIRHERYVDDFYIVAKDRRVLPALVPEMRERLAALGARLNERKFYCQHWTKGLECLGVHIKGKNVYLNRRTVDSAVTAARHLGRPSAGRVDRALASLNSYIGMARRVCGYKRVMEILTAVPAGWDKFLHFNGRRQVLEANESFRTRNVRKFNLT